MRPRRKQPQYTRTERAADGVKVLRLSAHEKEKYGLIASFNNDTSQWFPGLSCLADAIDYADQRGLKIRCISKPELIYRDLQGTRQRISSGDNTKDPVRTPYLPEAKILSFEGRKDLLERQPEDRGRSNKKAW